MRVDRGIDEEAILEACEFERTQIYKDKKKLELYFQIANRWLFLKIKGVSVAAFLNKAGYKKAAIYGMAELGNRLYEELKDSEIEVVFIMDINPLSVVIRDEILVLDPYVRDLPDVDVMIVTPLLSFEQIRQLIKERIKSPIISIEDLIYSL